MTRQEHLLVHCMEECDEVSQRISKAMRFGMQQVQQANWDKPEQNPEQLTNMVRIINEYNDLVAVMEMAGIPLIVTEERKAAKRAKVEKYLLFAKEQGTLT